MHDNLERPQNQGKCIWFTGLSGSGKTTTARALNQKLESKGFTVTHLDGDEARQHLSTELGFTKNDRETNIKRIGYVASLIVKHEGLVLCSCISPYRSSRDYVRSLFPIGAFFEVFITTPIEICEERDVKGLYQKARLGLVSNFTGISDSYEQPLDPEVELDTINDSIDKNVKEILKVLQID